MCDAVPLTPANAASAGDRCGQMLPLIGNAPPRGAARASDSYQQAVIDRPAARLSARNPTPPRGTAIAPQQCLPHARVIYMISIHPRRLRTLLLNLATATVAVSAANAQVADIASLQSAAEQAVRREIPRGDGQVIVQAQNLDLRLRLAECDRPLSAAIAGDGQARAHTTVTVRCEGAVHWTVYLSVTIDSEFSVLVANRALARDAELTAADFDLTPRRLPGLTTDYVTRPSMLSGQRLRQAVASGQALSLEAITPSNLIHRGQQVTLVAGAGDFQVRMNAVALSDGRLADRIKVQNLSSQRVVEGIVRSDNVVEVPL
jgi:flagellar basal body P-ring formation protein FlgA